MFFVNLKYSFWSSFLCFIYIYVERIYALPLFTTLLGQGSWVAQENFLFGGSYVLLLIFYEQYSYLGSYLGFIFPFLGYLINTIVWHQNPYINVLKINFSILFHSFINLLTRIKVVPFPLLLRSPTQTWIITPSRLLRTVVIFHSSGFSLGISWSPMCIREGILFYLKRPSISATSQIFCSLLEYFLPLSSMYLSFLIVQKY